MFDDGRALLLTEAGTEKQAGVWVVGRRPASTRTRSIGLGPDADPVDVDDARRDRSAEHSMRIHGCSATSSVVAGLGRRLANEICHRAQLSPFANASKLDRRRDRRARTRPSAGASPSRSPTSASRDDMSSSKERPGAVHHREGEPCPVCGDVVRAVEYRRYTVNYCATCQTGGKVLADNTTSKFLK